jgi:hypothetical protein
MINKIFKLTDLNTTQLIRAGILLILYQAESILYSNSTPPETSHTYEDTWIHTSSEDIFHSLIEYRRRESTRNAYVHRRTRTSFSF